MEKELDEGFFRIGRSFIVNLRFINRITRNEVHLKNGDIIKENEIFHTSKGETQQGTHEALVENVLGKYHELWDVQAQYYKTAVNA